MNALENQQLVSKIQRSAEAYQPRVGVVVVSYNSYAYIRDLLLSLEGLSYSNFFTVIVDNSSPDGSGERIRNEFSGPNTTVILNPENDGFASANNCGMREALRQGAEFLWLLNADTEVSRDALTKMVTQAWHYPDAAAFGAKILYGRGLGEERHPEARIWGAIGKVDLEKREVAMLGSGEPDKGQFESVTSCDYIPGCSLLVRASVLDDVGLMPEDYFMYFEETDWCMRMRSAGYQLFYVPESIVWHRFEDQKMQEPFGVYYFNRNSFLFWFRYGGFFERFSLVSRIIFRDLPRIQKALWAAPNESLQKIFRAHRASCIDFLMARFGKRSF